MKSTGGNEQNVIGTDISVFCFHYATFYNGQDIPLHAFAGNIGTTAGAFSGDFINLVQEDNAVIFRKGDGFLLHVIKVNQFFCFLLRQNFACLCDSHFSFFHLLGHEVIEHVSEIAIAVINAHTG